MSDETARMRIDWGHLALTALLAGITVWYLQDAWSASSRTRNLILVLPTSVLALLLALGIAIGVVYRGLRSGAVEAETETRPTGRPALRDRYYHLVLMAIFALYVLTLPVFGFDVGSALFILIALIGDGERRPLFLVLYPVVFAAASTLLFQWLLPYPMPTLIL